ncbi:MAG TPA: transglycosylase domain-containing protein, partial [Ramlibacter sp.]|nr:transglycosylase domain-containing protein [Ramlibacter sp.]
MPQDSPTGEPGSTSTSPRKGRTGGWQGLLLRTLLWTGGGLLALLAALVIVGGVALAVAYPNLPDISDLSDYRPKLPLRVYSADDVLLGEFGEERRNLTPIAQIPQVMKDAVLAIEDARFYSHGGVDYRGLLRAALANLGRVKSQGASTITMQVARNVYLSSEKTFTRKLYEVLLTFKLEHLLTKDQILEIYMNQIFLGNRAYGFAAASDAYFGKPMKDLTIAEAAMLAGLPKAPSSFNPIVNPNRARSRQLYIIERMQDNGFITAEQAEAAKKQELKIRSGLETRGVHAEYVAETVRQLVYAQYGEDAYTRGLNVFTTVKAGHQNAAYKALRRGIMDYERRQIYRGPEEFVELPANQKEAEDAIDDALAEHPDNGDVMSAVVLEANPKKILAVRHNSEQVEITGEGLRPA